MTASHSHSPAGHSHDHGNDRGDDHDHGAHHGGVGRGHAHGPANYDRAFAIGLALNSIFVAVEATYGFAVNSLALLADAGHNLGDVAGLAMAGAAAWLARRRASPRRTYGLGRTTIMASFFNSVLLLIAIGAIAWEAILRIGHPEEVDGRSIMVVAGIGILINTGTALMFMRGGAKDINIRGAFLHMAADAAVSAGVVIAAAMISYTHWLWIDPLTSLAIVFVIAIGTWDLFKESLNLGLDTIPAHIDGAAVRAYLMGLPGVRAIHDLHIWPLSTSEVALTVHLVMPEAQDNDRLLARISEELHDHHGICHATIQIERGSPDVDCRLTARHGA